MDNFKSFKKGVAVAVLMSTAIAFGTNNVYGMNFNGDSVKGTFNKIFDKFKPPKGDSGSGFEDVYELDEDLKMVNSKVLEKIRENPDKARVVIIGPCGSGKSTLRNLLSNIELVYQENPNDMFGEVFVIPRDSSFMKASGIGYGAEAVTFLPNLDVDNTNNVIYCDCPGFFDSHGKEREFINLHAIKALFKKPNKIKILVVIGADVFMTKNGRGKGLVDVVKKLNDIFPDKNSLKDSLALVITHVDRKYTVEAYEKALKGILQAWSNEANLDILEFLAQNPDRIFLFPNGKVGDKVEIIGKEKDKDLSAFLCDGKYVENLEFESKPSAEMGKYLEKISNTLSESLRNLIKSFGNIITDILDQAHNDVNKLELLKKLEGMVGEIADNKADTLKFLELLNRDDTRNLLSNSNSEDLEILSKEASCLSKAVLCLKTFDLNNFTQCENEIYRFIVKYQAQLHEYISNLEELNLKSEEQAKRTEELAQKTEEFTQISKKKDESNEKILKEMIEEIERLKKQINKVKQAQYDIKNKNEIIAKESKNSWYELGKYIFDKVFEIGKLIFNNLDYIGKFV